MPWKRKVVEERIKDGVIFFLIYNENGQLVGATGFDQKRNMFVHSLIDRKYRGNGYGRSMFLGLIELFKRHGIIELRAQALKRNNQAIKMFQNIGFEIIARESDDKYFTMVKVV
jgi:RimJ/RimL family protein N-acetyltransferase